MKTMLENKMIPCYDTAEDVLKLLSVVDEVVWIMSCNEKELYYVNSAFERLYGKTVSGFYADPELWLLSVHPDDRNIAEQSIEELLSFQYSKVEYRIIRPDGTERWVLDKKHIIKKGEDSVPLIGCISRDITDQRMINAKLKELHEDLRSQTFNMSLAGEKERRQIATELHDNVSQNLAYCKIKLKEIEKDDNYSGLASELNEINTLLTEAIKNIRSQTFELSPPLLYDLGLEPAIDWLGENIIIKRGMNFRLDSDEYQKPISNELRILLFQIVRELLNNIAKHSQASEVMVFIRYATDTIMISVQDNGIGFDESEISKEHPQSHGYVSIRERLNHIGGFFSIKSKHGAGTKVNIVVPFNEGGII
jgi:PAS domain S-box-containing protein